MLFSANDGYCRKVEGTGFIFVCVKFVVSLVVMSVLRSDCRVAGRRKKQFYFLQRMATMIILLSVLGNRNGAARRCYECLGGISVHAYFAGWYSSPTVVEAAAVVLE